MCYRYTADDQLAGYEYSDDRAVVYDRLAVAEEVLAVAVPFATWTRRAFDLGVR